MSNPFQIGEDADLSFGEEDFLLDSIDLEAIAAKALQTKPSTGQRSTAGNLNALQNTLETNQVAGGTTTQKQFQPFNGCGSANEQIANVVCASGVSTPQSRGKKFNFKKKSPENAHGGVSSPRPVLSSISVQNSCSGHSWNVSPVVAGAALTNDKVLLGARNPGGDTPNTSHRLRSTQIQPHQTNKVVQPPMGVTVRRDGTSIAAKPGEATFNPQVNKGSSQVNKGSSFSNLRTPAAQEMPQVNRNVLPSNIQCQPGQQPSPARGKVFQKFVQPPGDVIPNSGSHTLRTSQSMNQMSNTATQLRNPSMSSTSIPPKTSFTALNHVTSSSPSVQAETFTASQSSFRASSGSNHSNQSQQSFRRYQGGTSNAQNLTAPGASQAKNQPCGTPGPKSQFQGRSVSPMQASTPGYRTPTGGPSPGSGRSHGVTTPMQQTGQSSKYPATPRTGGSTFSTTGGTPGMRNVGNRPSNSQQPLLTPRVAQLCQTPSGNGSRSTIRTRARKFPGPAGVLPKLKPGQKLDEAVVEDAPSSEKKPEPSLDDSMTSLCSQDSVDEFQRGAWLTMKTELGSSAHSILSSYNIAIVLRKASLKQLPRKQVPNLCVMIRQITQTGFDACVMLKDPSGEMQGTLHRKIVEDYQADLKPGSVMVLRKVGVLSPTIRNHYLNITHSNLVQVYPPETASRSCSQTSPKSSGTRPRINRSPDSTDHEQSDFTNTKGSNSRDLQHNSDHHNNHKSPPLSNDMGNKPGHRRAKVLLIEGVNTPERSLRSSAPNQPVKNGIDCPDLVDKLQHSKTLRIEGIDLQGYQRNKSLPHAEDSGISLDASYGDVSLQVQKTKHEEECSGEDVSNSMSWLRKRQPDSDEMEMTTDRTISDQMPSKRRCLEMTKTDLSVAQPSLATSNIAEKVQAGLVGCAVKSEQVGRVAEENFASLLEGIEDELFDDF